jgi:glycerol-3-phosphate dehydrogenase
MARALAALAGTEFDVVVVGGGITGAATAWDAAQRGLSVALLERGDFGGATSAESLKVVHGGVRYLQHLDVVRVRESSGERRALLRMAPHLVQPMPFVVPTYGHGMRGPEILGVAFALLNALTADRNRGITDPARRIPAAGIVSRSRVLEWFPEINKEGLTGAGVFYDGQLFNPPRLVWALVRTAARGVAERAVDLVYDKLGRTARPSRTAVTRIHGGDLFRFDELVREVSGALPEGVDRSLAQRLAHDHGSAYGEVLRLVDERPELGARVGSSDILRAEVVHAARSEMVCKLSDAVFGRTGIATVGDPGCAELDECADLVGAQLGWDAGRRERELREVRERIPFRRA